jgi:2-phospho-L-lactate guanylyltransferase
MRAILIPVKTFRHSKRRLAKQFSAEERAALVAALCEDFFRVVAKVRGMDRIFVVSAEPWALHLAQTLRWETVVETEQTSESHSVDAASRQCAALGVTSVLRLPIDLPLARPADIESLLNEDVAQPAIVIVPSRDGTGTNALLRSPPDLFASHFGPDSFALHLAEAKRCGARVKAMHNSRIALDIDEVDDLRELSGHLDPHSATGRWLARHPLAPAGCEGVTGRDLVPPVE